MDKLKIVVEEYIRNNRNEMEPEKLWELIKFEISVLAQGQSS